MPHRREAFALMALSIGLTVSACTFPAHSPRSFAIQDNVVQSTAVTDTAQGKHLSAVAGESDCVLTSGDVHLWCNWITRYY